jgi:hypothetical protein
MPAPGSGKWNRGLTPGHAFAARKTAEPLTSRETEVLQAAPLQLVLERFIILRRVLDYEDVDGPRQEDGKVQVPGVRSRACVPGRFQAEIVPCPRNFP